MEAKKICKEIHFGQAFRKTLLELVLRRVTGFLLGVQCPPPPPRTLAATRSGEASSPTKITSSLGFLARSRHALCAGEALRAYNLNVDQRPVLLPFSRFRHNTLFLSSFSCSLIAVELHCDAWCSHEGHSTLQPLCGSVRVRCCRIFHEFVQSSNSSNAVQELHKRRFTCCRGSAKRKQLIFDSMTLPFRAALWRGK